MQRHESGGDGTTINGSFLPPSRIVGEPTSKFGHRPTSRVISSSGDDFYTVQSLNGATNFASFHGNGHFMEGIPLPYAAINTFPSEKYISFENQDKFPASIPLGYPLENVVSNSVESMLHGYGGPPFPPELTGRVVGRTSVVLPTAQLPHTSYSREWSNVEQNLLGLSSDSRDSSQLSNELSLGLVTSCPSILNMHSSIHHEQSSEMSSNGGTGYSLVSRTRFVEAMQEILAEIACYALENIDDVGLNRSFSPISDEGGLTSMLQKQEMSLEAKKKHLLALLQMADEQYSQCLDEIHTVTSAFHAVTELSPNLHMRFALPAISFVYKSLRERISSHIISLGAHQKEGETREQNSLEACFTQKQWALQQLSKRDNHQMWRPQRGLPETSVSVLRTWMFKNFLHPYPKDSEKHLLALRSGLTRSQVSNWFINARVRLWKPMIEEMCAEMNRRKARKENEEMEGERRIRMLSETMRFTRD